MLQIRIPPLMTDSHRTGTGPGQCTEMFILVQDRETNRDSLFPIVLVQFPAPPIAPGPITYTCTGPVPVQYE